MIGLPLGLWAQALSSISGRVADKKTGELLPGVNVVIESLQLGTVTNSKGEYKLSNIPAGNYELSISFIGYTALKKGLSLKKGKNVKLSFSLNSKSESLGEVLVSAKSKARKLREQAMPISVISMNQLSGIVNSITDVLNKTVGVTIRNTGGVGSASRISVRGLEGKRIGFFIDETPMSEHSDFLDLNDIPVDMIDRIEIYKGVVPAKFGGSAIGGAVNIVLREYPPKYLDVSYALESFNTHKISTVVKRHLIDKGLEIGVGGFYTYSDNDYEMELPFDPNKRVVTRDHDRFEKITIGGGLKARKWWFDEVVFEPAFIKTRKQIQGVYQNIQKAENFSEAYVLANHMEKSDFLAPGLDLDLSFAFAYTISGLEDKAKQAINWEGDFRSTASEYGGEITTFPSDSRNKQYVFQKKLNLNYVLNENNSLNFNLLQKDMKGIPKDDLKDLARGYKSNFDSKMHSWVTGLAYELRSTDEKWLNALTGKYYYYSVKTQYGNAFSNEVKDVDMQKNNFGINNALRYKFRPDFLVKASVAYDIRLPAENELLGDGQFIYPSGGLDPERNTSFNLGLLFDQNGKTRHNLQVELSGFYMYLKNMIALSGGAIQMLYKNFGEVENVGVEFEIKADITSWLYGYANTTYQDMRNRNKYERDSENTNPNKDKRVPNIPYLLANAGLEFHKENLFGGNDQNTRVFIDGNFIDEYSYDYEQSKKYKERVVPQTLAFNAGIEHSLMDGKLIFSVKANNITDKQIFTEFKRPQPGRNLGLKLRYILK